MNTRITKKELQLAGKLLEMAAEEFSNHGCNDLPDDFFKDWTKEEMQQLQKSFHDYNGDPENYNPDYLPLTDDAIMSYLSHKLLNSGQAPERSVATAAK